MPEVGEAVWIAAGLFSPRDCLARILAVRERPSFEGGWSMCTDIRPEWEVSIGWLKDNCAAVR
jgi:hypothetical protein